MKPRGIRNLRMATSYASSALMPAASARARLATAAYARISAAPSTPSPMAKWPPPTSIQLRKNLSTTSYPAAAPFPSPPLAAICAAFSARIGKLPSPSLGRSPLAPAPRKRWWRPPSRAALNPSPSPTPSRPSSTSTCSILPNSHRPKGSRPWSSVPATSIQNPFVLSCPISMPIKSTSRASPRRFIPISPEAPATPSLRP